MDDYSKQIEEISKAKSLEDIQRIAHEFPAAAKGEGGIWQRRYWEHTLRDEDDFTQHLDYIHFNPVKHGHSVRVRDWPFSSFRRWVRLGAYTLDWAGDPGDETCSFGEKTGFAALAQSCALIGS